MWLVLYNYSALFWHNTPTLPKNLLITWTPSTLLIALVSSFGNSSSSVWQNRFSTNFSMTWTKSFERQRESISILVFSFSLFSFDKKYFQFKTFFLSFLTDSEKMFVKQKVSFCSLCHFCGSKQCDQIGPFLQVLGNNCALLIWWIFGLILKNTTI